jgi:hypothetical protein
MRSSVPVQLENAIHVPIPSEPHHSWPSTVGRCLLVPASRRSMPIAVLYVYPNPTASLGRCRGPGTHINVAQQQLVGKMSVSG